MSAHALHKSSLMSLYRASALLPSSSPPLFPPSRTHNNIIHILKADITTLPLDAIVNAANTSLLGGGGVDGAIHRAAGSSLLRECRSLNGCPTGKAKITKGYNLPAKHIIHTVGPVYNEYKKEESEEMLRSCYTEVIRLARENGVRSLAFSGISTGIYGYPGKDAAEVACDVVRRFMDEHPYAFEKIVFVTFMDKDVAAYNETVPMYFPPEQTKEE
ncbi:macro domain-containing protein [Sarocladium implicatum]|nr:macro domain-containing protein [Sarocladium implicatum]